MAKRARTERRTRQDGRETNWWLIGGIVAIGTIALLALLFLNLNEQNMPPETLSMVGYCQENPENCVTKGADDAPVTVVEVSDYGCSHCRDFNLQTSGLIEDLYVTPGQVQWVVLPFALGEQTLPAAEAAMCAAEQEKFSEFHREMFRIQQQPGALTEAGFLLTAESLDMDQESLMNCLESGKYDRIVRENQDAATSAGVSGTPTFFVNDAMLRGNQPLTAFQEQILSIIGTNNES